VKRLALLVVLMPAATGAMAQGPNRSAWFGPYNNTYTAGSQVPFNLFGCFEGESDDYRAGMDAVDPLPAAHHVEVIFGPSAHTASPRFGGSAGLRVSPGIGRKERLIFPSHGHNDHPPGSFLLGTSDRQCARTGVATYAAHVVLRTMLLRKEVKHKLCDS
jgi:hypothetical protein